MKTMNPVRQLARLQARLQVQLQARLTVGEDDERGDVPGWVLVTVMTAGIVGALLQFARPELVEILDSALNSVTP